ncbi:MAG TPA: type III secretion system chaperone [Burkholderiaceae bacterium]|nr:type III secretion system chaperone [Burkholderiaceae bacterium]
MSATLQLLLAGITRDAAGAGFTCTREGHIRFLCDGKFTVDLFDDPDAGMVHLHAPLPPVRPELDSQPIDIQDGQWTSSVLKDGEDGFTTMMCLHRENGRILTCASAPMARLDAVRFRQWLERFLDRVAFFEEIKNGESISLPLEDTPNFAGIAEKV